MIEKPKIHYTSKCPICGDAIYPYPADHDGHCHIIHKTVKERIEELDERMDLIEEEIKG
jgi:hypothetical protein